MPRKPCYWTRKLELNLVEFVRQREFIWKPGGNTNHNIQQKYKAYAEFAAMLGCGFTARSVRDRWVNIRSTFNHNLRRVDKSRETATSPAEVYVPCWPLWRPLQFLRDIPRKDETENNEVYPSLSNDYKDDAVQVKLELEPYVDGRSISYANGKHNVETVDTEIIGIRDRGPRTDRPRRKKKILISKEKKNKKCKELLDDLLIAMRPIGNGLSVGCQTQSYWFFGKHITERLNTMRPQDAECASCDIMKLLNEWPQNEALT